MNPLSSVEIKLCQDQAKIFESSVIETNYSSPIFIRRFMLSSIAKNFDENNYLFLSLPKSDTFSLLDEEFGSSTYGKEKYSANQMYWIGYIYRCLAIKYKLSSKAVYRLFNARDIVKQYNIGHTFDIVQYAIRMMENINYNNDIEEKSLIIMRNLFNLDKLKRMIGKEVIVHNISSTTNPNISIGYIDELKTKERDNNEVYLLNKTNKKTDIGKVIAVLKNKDNCKGKLVLSNNKEDDFVERIKELIDEIIKDYKYKVVK